VLHTVLVFITDSCTALHAPSILSLYVLLHRQQNQQIFKGCTSGPSLALAGPQLVSSSCRAVVLSGWGVGLLVVLILRVMNWLATPCHILQPLRLCHVATPQLICWQHICAGVHTCCLSSALQLSAVSTWGQLLSLLLLTHCPILRVCSLLSCCMPLYPCACSADAGRGRVYW
jgi:hypothetical protein